MRLVNATERLLLGWILVMAPPLAIAACSHSSSSTLDASTTDVSVPPPVAESMDAGAGMPEDVLDAAVAEEEYVRPDVHRVLHLGDSTVGFAGGLTKALRPMFADAGMKYYGDSFTAAGIQSYDDDKDKRLQTLIKQFKPDMVIINMGMNNLTVPHPEVLIGHIQSLVKKLVGEDPKRVCYWIGPPSWKPDRKLLNPVLKENTPPCIFFNSSNLLLERQKDNVHPTDKGGQVWAKHFFYFFETGKELIDQDWVDGGGH